MSDKIEIHFQFINGEVATRVIKLQNNNSGMWNISVEVYVRTNNLKSKIFLKKHRVLNMTRFTVK